MHTGVLFPPTRSIRILQEGAVIKQTSHAMKKKGTTPRLQKRTMLDVVSVHPCKFSAQLWWGLEAPENTKSAHKSSDSVRSLWALLVLAMKKNTTHFISSFTEMSEKLFENGFPYCWCHFRYIILYFTAHEVMPFRRNPLGRHKAQRTARVL